MGASVSVQDPYEYSSSVDADEANMSRSILTWKLRRRSVSTSSEGSSFILKPEPVRINYLDVPYIDRHPFQDFRFGKKLGEGSFSVVFKGFPQNESAKSVAIKEIHYNLLSKQQLANINNEMNILSQLKHESIVHLYSVYSSGEKKFLIMEYLKGGQLLAAICKREFYHESDARRLMYQITSALVYLHDRMVIHRDIKPENIILADHSLESPVKLVDFGFATIETEATRAPSSQLVGSPGYFAPEVLKERSYSTKCDIWSLGVVFYIILSGLMPFPTDSAEEHRILLGDYYFPESRFHSVSESAKDLIRRMLVVNSEKRISAREVLNHPWMKVGLGLTPSVATTSVASTSHPLTQLVEEEKNKDENSSCDVLNDVDITGNLEFIRQHHATRKFNLMAGLFSSLSPKPNNSQSKERKTSFSAFPSARGGTPDKLIKSSSAEKSLHQSPPSLSGPISPITIPQPPLILQAQ